MVVKRGYVEINIGVKFRENFNAFGGSYECHEANRVTGDTAFLKYINGVRALMKGHRAILEPKFKLCELMLEESLGDLGIAEWNKPNGGYFISVDVLGGCAKRVVQLCKEAGVVLTDAGATYPYGKDPHDSNIRLAPSFPPLEELEQAMEVFCAAIKLAAAEKLLAQTEV